MDSLESLLRSALTFLALISVGGAAVADGPAPLRGGADVTKNEACVQGWVDVGTNSTPFFPGGEGLVLVVMDKPGKSVTTPSDRLHVNCKGTLPLGAQVQAIDAITGEWIDATLATYYEACDAVGPVWPSSCPGEQGPWFGSFERTGIPCSIFDPGTGETYFTEDWVGLVTASGQATFNCHFEFEE